MPAPLSILPGFRKLSAGCVLRVRGSGEPGVEEPYWSLVEVARDGIAAAETYSARPGHSEHQTGLAADLDDGSGCAFMACFGQTATGLWLRENAYRYGFILRYDDGQQPVVGYIYEPWHFRYVGVEVAAGMREAGIRNLEEYFGLPAAPSY